MSSVQVKKKMGSSRENFSSQDHLASYPQSQETAQVSVSEAETSGNDHNEVGNAAFKRIDNAL